MMTTTAHRSKKRLQQHQQQQQEDDITTTTTATTSSSSSKETTKQTGGGGVTSSSSLDNNILMDVKLQLQPPADTSAEGNRLRKIRRRESGNHSNNNNNAAIANTESAAANSGTTLSSRGTTQTKATTSPLRAASNNNNDISSSGDGVVVGGTSVSDQDDDDPEMTAKKPSAANSTTTTATTAASSVVVPKEDDSLDDHEEDDDLLDANAKNSDPCKGSTRSAATAKKSDNADDKINSSNKINSNNNKQDDSTTSRDYYFDSYAHHAIHEEMLKDEVRTKTYEMAIRQNGHLFQDKIVLDVGCGTGILSMFASQAGAKHVYAVDCSTILHQAREIVKRNGFGDDKITCIHGKVEEIELPVAHVDIIVSEWMGYFLLYESMLDTVIYARDKWLVPGGVVFPDKAVMYLTAMEDGNVKRERIDFWKDVYGFDMSPIQEIALREPVVDVVDAKALVTDSVPILSLDILTCTKEDLAFTSKFRLQAQRNDYVHGLVAYFECAFTQIHKPIGFSTAPFARYTHWKQTMFYLSDAITICAGETLEGEITCKPNKRNRRDLDIAINVNFNGRHSQIQNKTMDYRLR